MFLTYKYVEKCLFDHLKVNSYATNFPKNNLHL